MPLSSFNPFRSHTSTPQTTGAQDSAASSNATPSNTSRSEDQISPPPSFSSSPATPNPTSTSADSEPPRAPPSRDLDGIPLDLEEPPPYTPRPAAHIGETTLEQGPNRPFQPPPPRSPQPPPPQQHPPQQHPAISPQSTGWSAQPQGYYVPTSGYGPGSSLGGSGSANNTPDLVRQFTSSLNSVARNITSNLNIGGLTPQPTGRTQWSSYPGQQARNTPRHYPPPIHPPPGPSSSYFPPPPRHPLSASASTSELTPPRSPRPQERRHSSDFAREFYAAGTGDGLIDEPPYNPPPGPPPSSAPATSSSSSRRESSTPNDGRPTSHPVVGHPLLKDGKLLVYPKGYKCEKCLNVGYKNADPIHPCKKCWGKYAKPFSGPLAYSFNGSDPASSPGSSNFQKPLPRIPPPAPPPIPPLVSFEAPPAHFAPGGYMSNHHGGFYGPPNNVFPAMSPPVPGTVIYPAGDPRIGGRLCWRCSGKGNVSFMVFERMTCEVCGGVGRTFF